PARTQVEERARPIEHTHTRTRIASETPRTTDGKREMFSWGDPFRAAVPGARRAAAGRREDARESGNRVTWYFGNWRRRGRDARPKAVHALDCVTRVTQTLRSAPTTGSRRAPSDALAACPTRSVCTRCVCSSCSR